MKHTDIGQRCLSIIRSELKVAMGCTEPAAAALAGAKAREILGSEPDKICIRASRDMIKNAMGVGIPNSPMKGLQSAVALGIAIGNTSGNLSILSELSKEQREAAAALLRDKSVTLELAESVSPVFIEVLLADGPNEARAVIENQHDHFALEEKNGKILNGSSGQEEDGFITGEDNEKLLKQLTIEDIFEITNSLEDHIDLSFLLKAAEMNVAMAQHSLEHNYGLTVGSSAVEGSSQQPESLQEAFNLGVALAAAASDARMSGCPLPVVINSGSGNQGITISVPVLVMGNFLKTEQRMIEKALFLGNLLALSLSTKKERLSALCGVFTAAMGTSSGLLYLMGEGAAAMESSIQNMVANMAGILCDGAKDTCALKIYSCINAAVLSTKLAMKGTRPEETSGIIGRNADESVENLMKISHEGMIDTDKVILSIMMKKNSA